jgi:hypothetical protein
MALTGGQPTRAGDDDVRLVVFFASGWNTCTGGNTCEYGTDDFDNDWSSVRAAVAGEGGAGEIAFERYSYSLAQPVYSSCDTNQSIAISAAAMHTQVAQALARYPNAELMVVGHSLGGVVATYWRVTQSGLGGVGPSIQDRMDRSAVVTLDSPVAGLDWTVVDALLLNRVGRAIVELVNCGSAIPAELNLATLFGLGSLVDEMRAARELTNYHNGAAVTDAAIHYWTATLGGGGTRLFTPVAPSCLGLVNLQNLVGIAVGTRIDLSALARCFLDSHAW